MMATLPEREIYTGLGEIIKYGIIYDARLFAQLERDLPKLLRREPQTLAAVVARCCEIKADVVGQDETEGGLRAILNFGHTIGHAIENSSGYGKFLHGEAIAAFEQAIGLAPQKEAYHFHLGIALAYQMNYEKAILALQNSIAINPNFVLGHCALAANYRRVGKETEAQEHIAIARPSMEYEKEYNRACFESISGNADQAFAFLEIALEKEQCQITTLRSDTDLDFIRCDVRFEALLDKSKNVTQ